METRWSEGVGWFRIQTQDNPPMVGMINYLSSNAAFMQMNHPECNIITLAAEPEETCEGRLSSTVLWEGWGEIPSSDPIMHHSKTTENRRFDLNIL